MQSLSKYFDKLFILLFFIILCLPGIGVWRHQDKTAFITQFKREPYVRPSIHIKNLGGTDFKGIEAWFVDKMLFMPALSQIWSLTLFKMGQSSKPGQVIMGKDNWLFLGNDYAQTINQFIGKNRPTYHEINKQVTTFTTIKKLTDHYQIPFLVIVAPDKQEIYSEYLPHYVKKGVASDRRMLIQQGLKEKDVAFIDLKAVELQAKTTLGRQWGDLYMKGDSHWNYVGAYAAYQSIAKFMQTHGLQVGQSSLHFIANQTNNTDLTHFIQINSVFSNAPTPKLTHLKLDFTGIDWNGNKQSVSAFTSGDNMENPYRVINNNISNNQVCLLIGDSFSAALGLYFHLDCQMTIHIHNGSKKWPLSQLIALYHPTMIVYEIVQRALLNPVNTFQTG